MSRIFPPDFSQEQMVQHSQRLMTSFHHWTKQRLLAQPDDSTANWSAEKWAQALFEAPFALVSHGTEADPIFNYGNQQALTLWELDWQTFTQMPSRQSAAPMEQAERSQFLAEAKQKGFISNYRGIRTSSTGRQFWIEDAIIWDVLDEQQQPCGQAAMFERWRWIESGG